MADNKKPISFRANVGAGNSETLTYSVEEPATIERLVVRIYQGPELSLHVTPRTIGDNGNGRPDSLVEFVGQSYIDGDGDKWEFDLSEQISTDDVIEVEIANTATPDPNLNLSYDAAVHMELDRMGGGFRPLRAAVETVGGWF